MKDGDSTTTSHFEPANHPAGSIGAPPQPTARSSPSPGRDVRTTTKPFRAQETSPDEARILARLDSGDRSGAETELFQLYEARILARCVRLLRNQSRAEDVCQQVFLEACRDLARFERRSALFTWLCRIAKNRCLDAIKSQKSAGKYIDSDADIASDTVDLGAKPDALLDRERLLVALEECLGLLPPAMAETVRLRFQNDDLSYDELGVAMNTNPGTLNQRVIRALRHLSECLEGKGWTGG